MPPAPDPRRRLNFRRVTISRSPAPEPGVEHEIIPSLIEGVSTREQWLAERRPALLAAWHQILGRLEPSPADLAWFHETLTPRIQSMDGLAAYDRLTLELPLETDFCQFAYLLIPRATPPWPAVIAWTSSTPDWRAPEYWWGAWLASRGFAGIEYSFPADAEYLLRVRVRGAADRSAPALLDLYLDGRKVKRFEVAFTGNEEDEEQRRFETRVRVSGGRHALAAAFLRDDSINESPETSYSPSGAARRNLPEVDWFEIGGPFDVTGPGETESRKLILTCAPAGAGEACAGSILARLARRAWRRPVTEAETARLLRLYRQGRQETGEFEGGIELALRGILVSPHFLFRVERTPAGVKPGETHALNAYEIASRLSFFLWSSIPDEALLAKAASGELLRPPVLEAEARRMLKDPRASALTANFAGQWLHLRNLDAIRPNPELFPQYDSRLRDAMRRETELFFEEIVQEDRSILDLISAPHTYLNESLAKFYGIPGVEGAHFRRVTLPDARRGGILTMASVLAVTSYPTRTSPVIRGKWVLENLLGAPPPPPPPDAPELDEKALGKTVSMREQLAAHRANPACAACHNRMDAIGFALENYDAIGRYRTHDGGFPIDASGELPSGGKFHDAADLKRIFRENPQEFVLCLTEKLLTYALGRGVERTDKPVVRAIARDLAARDYRFSELVLGIVRSAPFQLRRAEGKETSLGTDE